MTLILIILCLFVLASLYERIPAEKKPVSSDLISISTYTLAMILSLLMLWIGSSPETFTLVSYSSSDSGFLVPLSWNTGKLQYLTLAFISFIGLCISLFRYGNDNSRKSSSGSIGLLAVLPLILLVFSSNLLTIFVFSSLTGIGSILIIAEEKKRLFQLKMLVTSFSGDLCLFAAMLIAWKPSLTFGIEEINNAAAIGNFSGPAYIAFGILLLVGILLKSTAFPFHFWLTTEEKVSSQAFSSLTAQIFRPAGIIATIKIAQLLPGSFRTLLVLIALLGSVLAIIQAFFCNELRSAAKYILISQTGLIIASAAIGEYNSAILLLAVSSVSWLALEHSSEIKDNAANSELSNLAYFITALVLSAVPFTTGFLSYAHLIQTTSAYVFFIPALSIVCILVQCLVIFGAGFNTMRFLFQEGIPGFGGIPLPDKNEYIRYAGVILLISGSLFIFVSLNPFLFIGSILRFGNISQISSTSSGLYFPALTVFVSVSLGTALSYFYSLRSAPQSFNKSKAFALDRAMDNFFAGFLVPKESKEMRDNITLGKIPKNFADAKELSTHITFSLLIIVIFYFIFRSM